MSNALLNLEHVPSVGSNASQPDYRIPWPGKTALMKILHAQSSRCRELKVIIVQSSDAPKTQELNPDSIRQVPT